MKEKWIKPSTEVQRFLPNAYCEDCSLKPEGMTVYFVCDGGTDANHHYDVYYANGTPYCTYKNDGSTLQGTFHPCEETHEVRIPANESLDDYFPLGYMILTTGRNTIWGWNATGETGPQIPVRIWTEDGTDCHTTENIQTSSWDTSKS